MAPKSWFVDEYGRIIDEEAAKEGLAGPELQNFFSIVTSKPALIIETAVVIATVGPKIVEAVKPFFR